MQLDVDKLAADIASTINPDVADQEVVSIELQEYSPKIKAEDLAKINEIKNEYLEGTILSNSPEEVQEATKGVPEFNFDENCYYLDENTLNEMGIKDITEEQYGYFIVKYDFSNANVEAICTKGYDGNYTLTQINEDLDIEGY